METLPASLLSRQAQKPLLCVHEPDFRPQFTINVRVKPGTGEPVYAVSSHADRCATLTRDCPNQKPEEAVANPLYRHRSWAALGIAALLGLPSAGCFSPASKSTP